MMGYNDRPDVRESPNSYMFVIGMLDLGIGINNFSFDTGAKGGYT